MSGSPEATKTFPAAFGSGFFAGSMEICTVSLVVAPQSRRNATAFSFPLGETASEICAFAQGSDMQPQRPMRMIAIASGFTI
jgi:hypothetical protein